MAQGYLGRDDLTSERFIDTDFGRLYKTGDLVRYQKAGVLECLGRVDNQVKIRGYRIELGEIEQAIIQHQCVDDVAVQPIELTGQPILVAYIVSNNTFEGQSQEQVFETIRKLVSEQLPAYMVPSMFISLDLLPLTPNGKIDRKALPSPELGGQRSGYEPPETDLQAELCKLWQDVLSVEKVGISDNFFALGGHSLLAIRMKMRLATEFGIELSIAQMLSNQNIRALADVIEQHQSAISEDDLDWMNDLMDDLED